MRTMLSRHRISAIGRAVVLGAFVTMFASLPVHSELTELDSPPAADVVHMLQRGGYVIYLRHARTDRSQSDQDHQDLANCATQRNLSDAGRDDAKAIGQAFRAKNILVDRVLASPYCRAKDTAQLAFGAFEVADGLRYLSGATPEQKPGITAATEDLLGQVPSAGKNLVLVSHTSNLKATSGIWPRDPAVAIIFMPDGNGRYKPVGKIEPSEWAQLAQ